MPTQIRNVATLLDSVDTTTRRTKGIIYDIVMYLLDLTNIAAYIHPRVEGKLDTILASQAYRMGFLETELANTRGKLNEAKKEIYGYKKELEPHWVAAKHKEQERVRKLIAAISTRATQPVYMIETEEYDDIVDYYTALGKLPRRLRINGTLVLDKGDFELEDNNG